MDTVLRALSLYLFLLLVFRISGKRSLAETTPFDLILLLVIGEATQQALLGDDYSLVTAGMVILTLVVADIGLSLIKERYPRIEKLVDDVPIIIVQNGIPLRERMDKERVDEEDVLAAARGHGLEHMDQIRLAILETNGVISIIPRTRDPPAASEPSSAS